MPWQMEKIHFPASSNPRTIFKSFASFRKYSERTAAEQEDRCVVLHFHFREGRVGFESVAWAFDVSVPTGFEIVNHEMETAFRWRGDDWRVACFFESMHGVERFVTFTRVARNNENFIGHWKSA